MQPDSKKRRLSSSSSSPNNERVCVVFRCYTLGPNRMRYDEYQIYIVDPNSSFSSSNDRYTPLEPTIRFGGSFPALALCGLNSTLYLFEGDDLDGCSQGTYAGKFRITPEILAKRNYPLQNRELAPIKCMHKPKNRPIALPTPDGKSILVFSSTVDYSDGPIPTFELYHVAEDEWDLLPALPSQGFCLQFERYFIDAYGFETESNFLVKVDHGIFVIDLSVKGSNWKHLVRWQIPSPYDYFIWMDDGLFFTRGGCVCDTSANQSFNLLNISSLPEDESKSIDSFDTFPLCITPLAPDQNGLSRTCLVQAETHQDMCRLLLDICSADIQKYKMDVEAYNNKRDEQGSLLNIKRPLLDVSVVKTLKFLVDLAYYPAELNLYSI